MVAVVMAVVMVVVTEAAAVVVGAVATMTGCPILGVAYVPSTGAPRRSKDLKRISTSKIRRCLHEAKGKSRNLNVSKRSRCVSTLWFNARS